MSGGPMHRPILSEQPACRAKSTSPQEIEKDSEEIVDVRLDASVSPLANLHHRKAGFKILGLDATPELFAIILVYFVQGILGISRLAVSFYFKDELGLDPAELAIFSGLSALPWLVKPVYGFLSDTVPIFGYRRRSYLALCGVIGCAAWSTLALSHPSPAFTTLLLLVASAGTACSDVVVDSIVVGASRNASASVAGSYQSLSWGVSAIGGILSAYLSGSLIEQNGVPFVFGLTAVFPLMTMGAALLIQEQRVSKSDVSAERALLHGNGNGTSARSEWASVKIREQFRTLRAAISQPAILYPAIFCFVWQATPSADTALFYFYTDSLGFGPEFLGKIRLVGSISALVGVWVFNTFLKKVQLRTIFKWTAITGTALSLTQLMLVLGINRELGISDQWFCLSDEILLTVLGRLSFMPVLVLAARVCPEGVEATLFATLMSVCNGGAVTGSFIGSVLTKVLGVNSASFDQLPLLVSICALGTLLPLPLLNLVPILDDEEDDEESGKAL